MNICHFNNNVEQPLRGQFKGFWKVHLLNVLHLYMTCCFGLKVEMTEACTRQKGHFFLYRHVLRYSETCLARLTNVFVRTALWSAVLPWLYSPYFWLIFQMSRVAMISCVPLYRSSACCCCCCCCSTLSAYRIYWPTKGLLLFWACRFTVPADCKQSTPVACLHLTAAVTVTERGCISVAHLYTLKLNKCLNHPQQTLY